MSLVLVIVATALGIAAAFSAVGKLRKMPQVMTTMSQVGVKDSQVPLLAILELLGALGLLLGIWVPILGVLAALGLLAYFTGAVIAHLRVKDSVGNMAPALLLAVISLVVLVLQLLR